MFNTPEKETEESAMVLNQEFKALFLHLCTEGKSSFTKFDPLVLIEPDIGILRGHSDPSHGLGNEERKPQKCHAENIDNKARKEMHK